MILKRQTVWLLTMLSLIIVLSVYYISMDKIESQETATNNIEDEQESANNMADEELDFEWVEDEDMSFIELEDEENVDSSQGTAANVPSDEMFDTIRLQRQDARGKLHEEYTDVIISTETDPSVQVEALEKIEDLQALSQQEEMVETIIRSKGYEDALVMTDNEQVNIYVKAEELSNEEVSELNQLAYEHLGIEQVRVGYKPERQ